MKSVYCTIYLVRHGQTEWNVKRLIQGQKNSQLTKLGLEQAAATAAKLQDIIFDDVFEDENNIKIDYRFSILVENPKYIKVLLNTKSQDYSIYNISKRKDKLNKI
jgi:probable phosphoglycerate mutase